jgi:hypothetical protein
MSLLGQALLDAFDDIRAVYAGGAQPYTFRRQIGEERSALLVYMRNVPQKEMDRLLLSDRFVGRRFNRLDIFTDELSIDSKRDRVRLVGSKNPDHKAPSTRKDASSTPTPGVDRIRLQAFYRAETRQKPSAGHGTDPVTPY